MPFLKKPVVNTIHEAYRDEAHREYYEQTSARAHSYIAEQLAKVHYVTVSKRQEELFGAAAQTFFRSHQTIHNGIPVDMFDFNDNPDEYLLYIGYITPEKGADIAVHVAQETGKKLILAGHTAGTETFFEETIRPYLSDRIQYVGPVGFEEKVELYANAVALLAPLRWEEPFGLTMVEAMACGTPVIALNKGAASEIISEGETGFVVDDVGGLLEAVGKLETLDRQTCRARVEEHFSVEKMTDRYEELYAALIKSTL